MGNLKNKNDNFDMEIRTFEKLDVWIRARSLRKVISRLVKNFPPHERFKLMDQLIRSSRSISANIAEGFGRFHYTDNIRFCRQALGSLHEVLDHCTCALDESYIDPKTFQFLEEEINKCRQVLTGYIRYLQNQRTTARFPSVRGQRPTVPDPSESV